MPLCGWSISHLPPAHNGVARTTSALNPWSSAPSTGPSMTSKPDGGLAVSAGLPVASAPADVYLATKPSEFPPERMVESPADGSKSIQSAKKPDMYTSDPAVVSP